MEVGSERKWKWKVNDDKGYEGKNVFKKESEDDGLKLLNLTTGRVCVSCSAVAH